MIPSDTPLIGASACLLGQAVRFDGGHKRQALLQRLGQCGVDFVPVCPELELGLGCPRPALQLRRSPTGTQLVFSRAPHRDLTDPMRAYAARRSEGLGKLDGFIFKKDSPSCGVSRVPLHINESGQRERSGVGLFAAAFMQRWPLIPVEEEGRLNDNALRENFFERVFAYRRWKAIPEPERNLRGLIEFHARHKLQLMARGGQHYRELGRLVAGSSRDNLEEHRTRYISRFMQIMALRPRPAQHVNVLQHIQGYLKRQLDSADKQELAQLFEAFRQHRLPLSAALVLLRHHLRKHPSPYLAAQHYLEPYPDELALEATV